MGIESKYIWMDGELVEYDKATVPFLTAALHYGAAVFEGIRCYKTERGAAVFRLREHIERLVNSAKVLGFRELPYTTGQLFDAVVETVAANGYDECYIRPLIYHYSTNLNLNIDVGEARVGIAVWEWGNYLGEEAREWGIRAMVSSYTRHHPNVTMTKAKISGNYANSYLAKTESVRLGFDEAIMLDPQGYVAECSGENIFLVRGGKIHTPPTHSILEGITRDSLLSLARDLGYEVCEQPISRDHLYIADEVFVCGTAAELIAIREIDHRVIGEGKMGAVTRDLHKSFDAALHGRGDHSSGWLTYVNESAAVSA